MITVLNFNFIMINREDISENFEGPTPIGQSKINERLHDMTLNRMLLDVRVSPWKQKKKIQLTSDYN